MQNKTEVINILKGTLFFFALVFAKNLHINAKFWTICSTHTLFTVRIVQNVTAGYIFIINSPFSQTCKILWAWYGS